MAKRKYEYLTFIERERGRFVFDRERRSAGKTRRKEERLEAHHYSFFYDPKKLKLFIFLLFFVG